MHSSVHISFNPSISRAVINIPPSKSEANRAIILSALANGKKQIKNLPAASDSHLLLKAISTPEKDVDAADAGTAYRFLTAYFVATQQSKILNGSERMCLRPIGGLVDGLKQLGGEIEYLGKEGYPPLSITGVQLNQKGVIELKGNISSQFISALMLVAPVLKNGLRIKLIGNLVSQPYIELTRRVLSQFGIESTFLGDEITIEEQVIKDIEYEVGGDWSAVSYWMMMVSLAENNYSLEITGLDRNSAQGDKKVIEIMEPLGVKCDWRGNWLNLTKMPHVESIELNLEGWPDLVPSVAVVCALKGIKAQLNGVEHLKFKESDRIRALVNELNKMGTIAIFKGKSLNIEKKAKIKKSLIIETYNDHRMALSFAPAAVLHPIQINNPDVVNKSYPGFWDDLKNSGFDLQFT